MKKRIEEKLREIENSEGLKILFCCESGSRAWGFPSPDSDYDARFIYTRPVNYYLSVFEKTDHLSYALDDELDINGWDIKKVLGLVSKSNAVVFEWLQSPIIYEEQPDFRTELWLLCQQYFSMKPNMYHYLGVAKSAFDTISGEDEIKIKKLFYVIRPLLAAKWCRQKKTIAPMNIQPLLELLPADILQFVLHCMHIKENAAEGYLIKIEKELKEYISSEIESNTSFLREEAKDNFDKNLLDDFFRKTINKYDHT